ncbi:hypothetical protein E8E14_010627 [Neopestalotiopsis sp. 37M]|nr:hypothetical protein E8E14_010627 [Neopestalotiopsis sp. 37M]
MQSLMIFALALLPAALGAPTEKRTLGDVDLYTQENFGGQKQTLFVGDSSSWTENCKTLPDPYAFNLGSFQPSSGILCRLYSTADPTCAGHGLIIAAGSDASVKTLLTTNNPEDQSMTSNVGQTAQSISCVRCTACT